LVECCRLCLLLLPLYGLLVVAGIGLELGHRRKPCKALAVAGDDDIFDAVLLLGSVTKRSLLSPVAGHHLLHN
jgi:hypothetical protein